jgi:hypothetical protein
MTYFLGAVITYRLESYRQDIIPNDNSPTGLGETTTHRLRQLTDRARTKDISPTMTIHRQL